MANEDRDGNVIQFPMHKSNDKNVVITDEALHIHSDLKFAEHLVEGLVVNLIHNMSENDIDVDDPNFIKNIGFLIEVVKCAIYKDMGLSHPMQGLIDMFVNTDMDSDTGNLYTDFDMEGLSELIQNTMEIDSSEGE